MFWVPARVALLGIVTWIAIRVLSPIEAKMDLSNAALIFIGFCYAAFFFGCAAAHKLSARRFTNFNRSLNIGQASSRIELLASILGILGILLRFYDRTILRGASYGAGSAEVREVLANSSVGVYGIIGSLFFPFCMIPFLIIIQRADLKKRIPRLIFSIILFSFPMIESLGQLSRSVMLITSMMMVTGILCVHFEGKVFKTKIVLGVIAGAAILISASTFVFDTRLRNEERSLDNSILTSVYSELISPTEKAIQQMVSGSEYTSSVYKAVLSNSLYYTSGLYEFSILWERSDSQSHAYGAYMLGPFFRAADLVIGTNFTSNLDEAGLVYRIGVFNTFFGPLWIDFSWISFLIMFVFGYFCTNLSFTTRYIDKNYLPLYLMTNVIVFYMPVVNFISNGLGLFFIISFWMYAIFMRNFSYKSISK